MMNTVDFYMASLELGEATVSSIAQKADIDRINAYDVLDRPRADGLVATVQKGARGYVIPQAPIAMLTGIATAPRDLTNAGGVHPFNRCNNAVQP